ncbi:MAG: haloacid dehalogenase type II [Dermatophilaceae bacterium]|nr:haloacid dehalogenase type II [Intrasporangiaceae bacterium]
MNRRQRPRLLIFDVNETLSDMSPMAERFAAVGAPAHLAKTWFAALLRDGFALTTTGANPSFAELGDQALRGSLAGQVDDLETAVEHIMAGFTSLPVHPDVVEGIHALHGLGVTLVTLSNGSASVAQGLVDRNGLGDAFERLLSVEDAPTWKPAHAAYGYALEVCQVEAEEAMLVAVHPWDIHGAHEAGLATAWINRTGRPYPSYFARPDIEVTSVVDLAARLDGDGRV